MTGAELVAELGLLVAGAALGVVFQELYDVGKKAKRRNKDFRPALESLERTIDLISAEAKKIDGLADYYHPRDDLRVLHQQLKKARDLVSKCSHISWWNLYKKSKYQIRLREFDSYLEKLSKVEFQKQLDMMPDEDWAMPDEVWVTENGTRSCLLCVTAITVISLLILYNCL